jgi:hypothetical protein
MVGRPQPTARHPTKRHRPTRKKIKKSPPHKKKFLVNAIGTFANRTKPTYHPKFAKRANPTPQTRQQQKKQKKNLQNQKTVSTFADQNTFLVKKYGKWKKKKLLSKTL